mgnify:FL=1
MRDDKPAINTTEPKTGEIISNVKKMPEVTLQKFLLYRRIHAMDMARSVLSVFSSKTDFILNCGFEVKIFDFKIRSSIYEIFHISLHKKFQGDYLSLVVHHTVHTGAYWYKTGGTYACAFSENPKS